ncbi:hypothetical protein BKA82DRAFT_32180 [Pisolithus tinctorius]|uniref:Uncharacterized protein n=1 Tax=Pisolithus tinctorius Marx 270 TaxID=870435 RepID=A0A0C3JIX4_PISTI|nr:hypothetical protein BKA82DRAFT_32180 [Pisolithus tinctorius]KIN97556.1 hypothetical protein M404DRAFT_32180 [Pisolithus tinctorius Marx 270]
MSGTASFSSNYLLSDQLAEYMRRRVLHETHPCTTAVLPQPLEFEVQTFIALNQMAATLAQAYRNPLPSGIELIRLSESLSPRETGFNLNQEAHILSAHPPYLGGYLDVPAIILGEGDAIALWYLPSAMSQSMQDQMVGAIPPLSNMLTQSISDGSWRTSPDYFGVDHHLLAGCLELSLARHQLGHAMHIILTRAHQPSVSADLAAPAARQWIQAVQTPLAILLASLSIMHPSLYNASHQAMRQLSKWSATNDPEMAAVLQHWPTIYTNISMIANQSAPLHRDLQSCANWYDMLVSVGNYS